MVKKIIFFIIILYGVEVSAYEIKKDNLLLDVYTNLYVDIFYSNNKPSNFIDDIHHELKSYSFLSSSNAGISLDYNNFVFNFEAGMEDSVRLFNFKYFINKDNNHFIKIGRDSTLSYYTFGQTANNLAGLRDYGNLNYDNRRFQIGYGIYGFQLSIIMPYFTDWNKEYINDSGANIAGYQFIPRLELSYDYQGINYNIKTFAGYGYYLYDYNNQEKSIHTATIGIGSYSIIDEKSSIYLSAFYGFNANLTSALTNSKSVILNNNKITMENIHSFGISAGFKYDYSKLITAQAGIGYTFNYADTYKSIDDSLGAYLNIIFKINDYFSVIPELSLFNNMQSNNEQSQGYKFMAGVTAVLEI